MVQTTTTLKLDGASVVGDVFQITAIVQGSSPTGTVTLKDGSNSLRSVALIGGTGTFTISGLQFGTHTFWVSYLGDPDNEPSDSPSVLHMVRKAVPEGELTRFIPTLFSFEQSSAVKDWVIAHGLGRYPVVDVYVMFEGQMNKIIPSGITYVDLNTLQVNFTKAYSGYATMV